MVICVQYHAFQMTELEVSKQVAERTLREHKGDIIKALHALTE